MQWKKYAVLCAAVAVVSLAGVCPALASVVREDYKTTGDGLITFDSLTGLKWLDATVTLGESPDQALAANPGFELATLPQVIALLEDAGIAVGDINTGGYYTADESAQNTLSQQLRLTDFWVQYYGPGASGWEYQGFGNVLNSAGTGWGQESLDTRNPPLGSDGASSSFTALNNCLACSGSNNFDFLVESTAPTSAPEPGSASLLMGAGLVGIGLLGKWRRRKS
jgi:MYXO-CTERM domain-containing protein